MEMFEKEKVRFFMFLNDNGNYTVDVHPEGKNVFRIFFHIVINFINETNYNNIL